MFAVRYFVMTKKNVCWEIQQEFTFIDNYQVLQVPRPVHMLNLTGGMFNLKTKSISHADAARIIKLVFVTTVENQ